MVRDVLGEAGTGPRHIQLSSGNSANLLEDVAVSKIRTLRSFGQSEMKKLTNQKNPGGWIFNSIPQAL